MIQVIQANLRKGYAALSMLQQFAREQSSEICVVSEPPPDAATRLGWHVSPDGGAAIILTPPRLPPTSGSGRGFVWVKLGNSIIVSCYFSPSFSLRRFSRLLQSLETTVNHISGPTDQILIAGDFNVKATAWGAPDNDAKGNMVIDFVIANGLDIANTGSTPTFSDTKGEHLSST